MKNSKFKRLHEVTDRALQIAKTKRKHTSSAPLENSLPGNEESMEVALRDDTIFAKSACDLVVPNPGHDSELIKHRFLCRAGALAIVGDTGLGKSSLRFQIGAHLALGKATFGLEPTRPHRILIVQAENDEGDEAEIRQGMIEDGVLTAEELAQTKDSFIVVQINAVSGDEFLRQLRRLIEKFSPDIVIIDPALAYIGANPSDPEKVGRWLRIGLNPILSDCNCAAIIIHHTPKGNRNFNGHEQNDPTAYEGMGCAEWGNWPRAVMVLKSVNAQDGIYKLTVVKRGSRLRWRKANGERQLERFLRHSPRDGVIAWHELSEQERATSNITGRHAAEELLALIPLDGAIRKTELFGKAQDDKGMSQRTVRRLFEELEHTNQIHIWKIPNPSGARSITGVARQLQPPPAPTGPVQLALVEQPSQRGNQKRQSSKKGRT